MTPDMPIHDLRVVDERRGGNGGPPVSRMEGRVDGRIDGRSGPPAPVRRALLRQEELSDAPSSPGWYPEEKALDADITARIGMLIRKRRELRGEIARDKTPARRGVVMQEGTPSEYGHGVWRGGMARPVDASVAPRRQPRSRMLPPASVDSEAAIDSDWSALGEERDGRGVVGPLMPARGYVDARRGRDTPRGDRRRPPKSAAIAIKGKDENFSYREALLKAREAIPAEDRDVDTRVRRAANGALLIEVMGKGNSERANRLASHIRDVLKDEADVRRPVRRARLRLSGMDDSVTKDEIVCTLSGVGECSYEEIKISELRLGYNGLYQTFAQLPLAAALRVANCGRVRMGWSSVRVDLLRERPSQCYKCWDFGHVRGLCRSSVDYTGRCFGCGGEGHTANACTAELRCLVCANRGDPSSHRIGSAACEAVRRARKMRARTPVNNNYYG